MKIIIIGGTGRIGSNLAYRLSQQGHTVIAATPSWGVNSIRDEEVLPEIMKNADVVVDVSNPRTHEDGDILAFFKTSTINLIAAGLYAGRRREVAMNIVGADRLPDSGYLRARMPMSELIR